MDAGLAAMEAGVSPVCFPAVVQTAFGADGVVGDAACRPRVRFFLLSLCKRRVFGVLTALTFVLPSTKTNKTHLKRY